MSRSVSAVGSGAFLDIMRLAGMESYELENPFELSQFIRKMIKERSDIGLIIVEERLFKMLDSKQQRALMADNEHVVIVLPDFKSDKVE